MFHKTNSTYFSDLDESRVRLLARIFPHCFSLGGRGMSLVMGGTACTFFKPIAPFQRYEVRSQVLSWDDKWLYVGSWFLAPGASRWLARPDHGQQETVDKTVRSKVFAAAISKYRFKSSSLSLAPVEVLRRSKILVHETGDEERRKTARAQNFAGPMEQLGAIRDAFLFKEH